MIPRIPTPPGVDLARCPRPQLPLNCNNVDGLSDSDVHHDDGALNDEDDSSIAFYDPDTDELPPEQ